MQKNAFTLAEALLTVTVIGVLAAITVPTLFSDTNEKQFITQLKKTAVSFNNALELAILDNENLPVNAWQQFQNDPNAHTIVKILVKNLNFRSDCSDFSQCFANNYLPFNGGSLSNIFRSSVNDSGAVFALIDGTSVIIDKPAPDCDRELGGYSDVCSYIFVDVNGAKRPNHYGLDVFGFYLRKTDITPFGLIDDTLNTMENLCSKTGTANNNGLACTAWAIYNNNMEYRRCSYGNSGIKWNENTKCPKF